MTHAKCRACGAEIIWAVTSNDKRMPLDAKPVSLPPGHYVVSGLAVGPFLCEPAQPIHLNHWATCPNREQFKQRPEAKRG